MGFIPFFRHSHYLKILLFITLVSSVHTSSAQVELKANLPLAAVLIPNVGVEFQVGKKTSLQLDVLGSFWDSIDGDPLQITQLHSYFGIDKNQKGLSLYLNDPEMKAILRNYLLIWCCLEPSHQMHQHF